MFIYVFCILINFLFFTLLKFYIIGFAWEAFDFGSIKFRFIQFIDTLHFLDL